LWGSNAHALAISPPVLEYHAKPGDALIDAVRVFNDQAKALTLYVSAVNAIDSGDELGTPTFYPASQDIEGQSMARWVAFEREPLILKPGEEFSQPFTINVPENAQPGGHYGALVFSTVPPGAKSKTVSVSAEIAVLFLVDVEGTKEASALIASISPVEPRAWYETMPSGFVVRVENTGSTFIKPVGGVTITNMLGITTKFLPLNKNGGNVLPKTIRRFEVEGPGDVPVSTSALKKEVGDFGFGRYTARVALGYGVEGQIIEGSYSFYVFSWRVVLLGLGAAALIFGVSKVLKKMTKKSRLQQL